MRWFKHMTATKDDEKIVELLAIGGLEAYGFYWAVIELIARQMEKESDKCSVTYPLPYLSRQLYCHHNKVTNLLSKLQVTGLMEVNKIEVDGRVNFKITCSNLLKYRDEYSKRKDKTTDNIPTKSEEAPEQETDIETDTEIDTEADTKQIQKKKKEKKPDVVFEIPEELNTPDFLKLWQEWQLHLKEKKAKTTASAFNKQLAKLADFGLKKAVHTLNYCIEKSWQGIYEDPVYAEKERKQAEADAYCDDGPSDETLGEWEREIQEIERNKCK
jgi:hypothetical protein